MMSAVFTSSNCIRWSTGIFHPYFHRDPDRNAPFRLAPVVSDKPETFFYNPIFQTLLLLLLHFEDRNSMAFRSNRGIFSDHRLVESGFRLKSEDRTEME